MKVQPLTCTQCDGPLMALAAVEAGDATNVDFVCPVHGLQFTVSMRNPEK